MEVVLIFIFRIPFLFSATPIEKGSNKNGLKQIQIF